MTKMTNLSGLAEVIIVIVILTTLPLHCNPLTQPLTATPHMEPKLQDALGTRGEFLWLGGLLYDG